MIRKTIIICGFLLSILWANAQDKLRGPYKIAVNLTAIKDRPKIIYLQFTHYVNGKQERFIDSSVVKGSMAWFKGVVAEPVEAMMTRHAPGDKTRTKEGDYFQFYLSAGNIVINSTDSLNNFNQAGGFYQKDYKHYKLLQSGFEDKVNAIVKKIRRLDRKTDSVAFFAAFKQYGDTMSVWTQKVCKNYVIQHPGSPVSLLAFKFYLGFIISNPNGADSLYQLLNPQIKTLPSALNQKKLIDIATRTKIGNNAPLFSQADTAGKMISLASFKGKYVLLDFWASWCGPCRAENPNVIANFKKYKNQNFTILSVSLDGKSGKEAWIKAIQDDHLTEWTHVSDLEKFDNAVAKLYGVNAIPQNFLIGPDGKILAANLRGQELDKKLAQLLEKK